jgi:lipopolysaccharide export system protein LptC
MTVRWIAVGVVLLAAAVAAAWNFRQRLDVKVTTAPVTVGAIVR